MKIIGFGEINKNLLYIILPSIVMFFETLYFDGGFKPYDYIITFNLVQAISKCLTIIPMIYSYIKNKSLDNKYTTFKENLINKKYTYKYQHINLRKFGFLSICIGLTLIFKLLHYAVLFTETFRLSFWMFDLFYICLYSYFILNVRLYRHQYFSATIILILAILLNIINYVGRIKVFYIFSMVVMHAIYGLSIIMKKYVFEFAFTTVYELIFYEGFASLIFFIILFFIAHAFPLNYPVEECGFAIYNNKCYFDNFYSYYDIINAKEILIVIFMILYYLVYYIGFNSTIKHYTACHIYLISFFEESIMYRIIRGEIKDWKLVPNIIVLLLSLFMLLVFNEIIEIKIYNLDYNTKRNIEKRAKENDSDNCDDFDDRESDDFEYNVNVISPEEKRKNGN